MGQALEQLLATNSRLEREIEAQRLTEADLLRIKNQYADAQQLACLGSWEWDIGANVVSWSAELYRIYGVEAATFAATYEGFLACVHPDDRERVATIIDETVRSGRGFHMWHRLVRPDGAVRAVEARAAVVAGEGGVAVRIYGTCQDVTDAADAEAALRESEERFRATFDNAGTAIAHIGPDGAWLRVNQKLCDLFGYSREELLQTDFQALTLPEDLHTNLGLFQQALAGEIDSYTMEKRYVRKDGGLVWANLTVALVRDSVGRPLYFVSVVENISARKRIEDALHEARAEMRAVIDAVPGGVVWIDADLTYRGINRHLARLLRMEPENIIGQTLGFSNMTPSFVRLVTNFFASDQQHTSGEIELALEGGPRTYLVMAQKYLQGRSAVFVGVDITDRKHTENRLIHDVLHDNLTGLANRGLFIDRLKHAVSASRRHPGRMCAVLFFDCDRFKNINDTLGHVAGDELLTGVARRLERCLRPEDTVARLGGDEFAILLDDIDDINEAMLVAERVREELSQPFSLRADSGVVQQVTATVSIGIAHNNSGDTDPAQLLRNADIAMYRAKSRGRSCYELFDDAMHEQAMRRVRLVADLRRALDRDELCVHYQPLLSLTTSRLIGFEALVRWQHPDRGLVLPGEFVPLAAEIGLITALDRWVLGEACRQLHDWRHASHTKVAPPQTGINCSSRFFYSTDFYDEVMAALAAGNIDPPSIMLEVTEGVLMENPAEAEAMLGRLRATGLGVCLDDFGTGYTSLSLLHRFPIDTLKIDRQFVDKMAVETRTRDLVQAMVTFASNLGIDVVAEGIETTEQLKLLTGFNIERDLRGQGHLFSAPITAAAATQLLQTPTIR